MNEKDILKCHEIISIHMRHWLMWENYTSINKPKILVMGSDTTSSSEPSMSCQSPYLPIKGSNWKALEKQALKGNPNSATKIQGGIHSKRYQWLRLFFSATDAGKEAVKPQNTSNLIKACSEIRFFSVSWMQGLKITSSSCLLAQKALKTQFVNPAYFFNFRDFGSGCNHQGCIL